MSHSYTKLLYHCVFSTKDRKRQIKPDIRHGLYAYIAGILERHEGRLIRAGGTEDHVHLLFELRPTTALADIIRLLKTNSSKWVHESFPEARSFRWQTGYAVFTVSRSSVDAVLHYIEDQEAHHRSRSFDDEYREFLRRHTVTFDERFVLG